MSFFIDIYNFILLNKEFFLFILFLFFFLLWKRKKIEISGFFPFFYVAMYKTNLGLKKMNLLANKHRKSFLSFALLSLFIGIVGMIFVFFFMFWQLWYILKMHLLSGGGLVLPIKTSSGLNSSLPIFYVPFIYWIIALFILVIVHEFAHGVVAERFKVKIKSSGFAFFGFFLPILPAAFVEPDEKDLKKKKWWKQIAVLGAGSTSNFLFGFLFLLGLVLMINPLVSLTTTPNDIHFTSVMNNSGLKNFNISNGTIIAFNGIYNPSIIYKKLRSLKINQSINLTINSSFGVKTYRIKSFINKKDSKKPLIGVLISKISFSTKSKFWFLGNSLQFLQILFFYIIFLNLGIGIMNLLPLWITDGGQIAKILFERFFSEKKSIMLYNLVSTISLILIIFTIWPSFLSKIIGF